MSRCKATLTEQCSSCCTDFLRCCGIFKVSLTEVSRLVKNCGLQFWALSTQRGLTDCQAPQADILVTPSGFLRTGTSNLQLPPRSPPSGFLLHQCSPAAKGTDTVFLVLSLFLCQCESEILPSQTRWVPLRLPPSDALAQTLLLSWPFPSNSVLNTQKSFSCRILYKTANCCALPIS